MTFDPIPRTGGVTHQCLRLKVILVFPTMPHLCPYGHQLKSLTEFFRSHLCLAQMFPKNFLEIFCLAVLMMHDRILGRFFSLLIFPSLSDLILETLATSVVPAINTVWFTPQDVFLLSFSEDDDHLF